MTGIYIITNEVNSKCYIGKSEISIEGRWKDHINKLKSNKHINRNSKPDKLQKAWNKYGEDNFTFDILEECLPEECNEREIYWIAYYDSFKNGYNQTLGGEINYWQGKKRPEETKKKISNSKKGQHHTEVAKLKISKANKGKKRSEEAKEKMSEAAKNRKMPEDFGKKVSEALKGKPKSEEHIKKVAAAHKGMKYNKNKRDPQMYEDIKDGINYKDFYNKYKSYKIYYSIKKELKQI